MNDLDAFLKKDAPNPKRRASSSSSIAWLQIQNLEGLIIGTLHGGMDMMKLEGQFRAGGDDRIKTIREGSCRYNRLQEKEGVMKNVRKDWKGFATIIAVVCGIIMLGVTIAGAWDCHTQILPMQKEYYGKTYSEWAVKWWQWAIGTPASSNPIIDVTGEFCASGQKGPVWFLATTLGWNPGVVRECTIPYGKSLFFPVINAANFLFPGDEWNEPDLRASAACGIPTELIADIDGVPVKNLYQYFEHSPIFEVQLPEGDIFGLGPMLLSPAAGGGYYLFLEPLSKGKHTIHWKATWTCPFAPDPFTEEVTYNLTVGKVWR